MSLDKEIKHIFKTHGKADTLFCVGVSVFLKESHARAEAKYRGLEIKEVKRSEVEKVEAPKTEEKPKEEKPKAKPAKKKGSAKKTTDKK